MQLDRVHRYLHYAKRTNCTSAGLPKFETRVELLRNPVWSQYFIRVYKEVPSTHFPICVADLQGLDRNVLSALGFSLSKSLRGCPSHPSGLLFKNHQIASQLSARMVYVADRRWEPIGEPPWMVNLFLPIIDSNGQKKRIPSSTWVEVRHRSSFNEKRGMWFAVMSGTGVWFNTGRTIVFRTHTEAFVHFGAEPGNEDQLSVRAGERGYNTIQFTECDGIQSQCCSSLSFPPRCFNLEFVATRLDGRTACGGVEGLFRAGWNASSVCVCDENRWGSSLSEDEPRVRYTHCK